MSINPVNRLQAQAFLLGSNLVSAGATASLSGTAATPLILDDLIINSLTTIDPSAPMVNNADQTISTVTDIRVSGQSFFASNQAMPLTAFSANSKLDGTRSLGATIDTNQLLEVEVSSTKGFSAQDPISFSCSTAPIPPGGEVVSPNDLPGSLLSYCFGLGSFIGAAGIPAIAAGAPGVRTFQATCLRDQVTLGRLVGALCYNAGPATDSSSSQVRITSIKADGIELLSSRSPSTEGIGFDTVLASASDQTGLLLNYTLALNSQVTVEVSNFSGQVASVVMGAFCRAYNPTAFQA